MIEVLPPTPPWLVVSAVSAMTMATLLGRDVEFFGDDLLVSGFDAHADFRLAGENADGAVFVDAQPGIQPRGRRSGHGSERSPPPEGAAAGLNSRG